MDIFDCIIKSFDHVSSNPSNWSRDSIVDAISLSKAMLNFDFIIALHTVEQYMSYTESLTRSLQAKALDLLQAVKHVSVLKQVLTDARTDVDRQFHSLFLNASKYAERYDISVSPPRRCQRQTARENHPANTTEDYYRRSLAIPFLEEEIEKRFTSHSIMAIKCLGIIPSCFSSSVKADDNEMIEFFRNDISFESAVKTELQLWRTYFRDKELPETAQSSLQHANPLVFLNIRKMLIHIMILPVISCEAERSFSTLRRIKTYLRSTMKQERLTGLALLNVHNSTPYMPSTNEIRVEFLKKNHRLMESKPL